MHGRLYSLTDLLKQTLYFFETLTVKEIAPYVRKKMLRDLSLQEVEAKVEQCLSQHSCFKRDTESRWCLDYQGSRVNDPFYHLLLKRQQPVSLWELRREEKGKKAKFGRLITDEANLIADGRFVQFDTGMWGLTEWELGMEEYPLKFLVLKVLRAHPGGLSLNQIVEAVNSWRPVTPQAVEGILRRFPFFVRQGDAWTYNSAAQAAYDSVMKRFLDLLREQKKRHLAEREAWQKRAQELRVQLSEIGAAHQQAAAALTQQAHYREECEHLSAQLSEKELLLALRKRELIYYRDQIKNLRTRRKAFSVSAGFG